MEFTFEVLSWGGLGLISVYLIALLIWAWSDDNDGK